MGGEIVSSNNNNNSFFYITACYHEIDGRIDGFVLPFRPVKVHQVPDNFIATPLGSNSSG